MSHASHYQNKVSDGLHGPASSVDNAVARFDGITGKVLQSSLATLTDAGLLAAPVLQSGDLELKSKDSKAHWRFVEHPNWIEVINLITGQKFQLQMVST